MKLIVYIKLYDSSLAIKDDTVNFKSSESIRDIKNLLNSNEVILKEDKSNYHHVSRSDSGNTNLT